MTEKVSIVRNKGAKNRQSMWNEINLKTKKKKKRQEGERNSNSKHNEDQSEETRMSLRLWPEWRTCWWHPVPLWNHRIWSLTCLSPGCRPSLSAGHPEERRKRVILRKKTYMIEHLWDKKKTGNKKRKKLVVETEKEETCSDHAKREYTTLSDLPDPC